MLEIKDVILTHDKNAQKELTKELLFEILSNPSSIVNYTFPFNTFMLTNPKPLSKSPFGNFNLGKIFGQLKRKDLYEDR